MGTGNGINGGGSRRGGCRGGDTDRDAGGSSQPAHSVGGGVLRAVSFHRRIEMLR